MKFSSFILKGTEWKLATKNTCSIKCNTNKCIFFPEYMKKTIDEWRFQIYLNETICFNIPFSPSECNVYCKEFCTFEKDKVKVYMKKDFDFIKITGIRITKSSNFEMKSVFSNKKIFKF
jgi:hypothetical protein